MKELINKFYDKVVCYNDYTAGLFVVIIGSILFSLSCLLRYIINN